VRGVQRARQTTLGRLGSIPWVKNSLRTTRSRVRTSVHRLKGKLRPGVHQVRTDTETDRYPEIFRFVFDFLRRAGGDRPNILSFGCSTGEECFSIRQYSPQASILGLDILRENVYLAQNRNHDPGISFRRSTVANLRGGAPYDAIFAMSVLCRWPDTMEIDECSKTYPYRRFEKSVSALDEVLAPGGLLIIYNANFCFTDSATSERYAPLTVPDSSDSGFVHKFSTENRKLRDQDYGYCVFRKNASRVG
jgi:SAM-dependent methyltransferase